MNEPGFLVGGEAVLLANKRSGLLILGIFLFGSVSSAFASDLAQEVIKVFEAKCAECHGDHLPKPKGRFGYVLDLKQLSENPLLVTPKDPDQSELYLLLVDEDPEFRMPPPAAKGGQMTGDEIQLVRRWIEKGAEPVSTTAVTTDSDPPVGDTLSGDDGATSGPITVPPPSDPPPAILVYLGKFHPLVVHFPVALILAAAIAELLWLFSRRELLDQGLRFCVLFAAVMTPIAGVLGWFAGEFEGYSGLPLTLHKWIGVGNIALALLSAYLGEAFRREGSSLTRAKFRYCLWLNAVSVCVGGHFGGVLVYGPDHLIP